MSHAIVAWLLVGLLVVIAVTLVVLLIQARKQTKTLTEQAKDLARRNLDAVVRATDGDVCDARAAAAELVRRAREELERHRDVDGDLDDYLDSGGGS